jgi:hypothetical protein
MVQRIVVRTVEDATLPGTTTIDAVRRIGVWIIIPAACIVIIAVVMANDDRPSRETPPRAVLLGRTVVAAVVAILAVLLPLLLLLWRRQQCRRVVVGFAVSFDDEGVHLENVVEVAASEPASQPHRPVPTTTTNTTTTTNHYESIRFIDYGEIKDCVVTEIILVHAVENALVLRLLPHDDNDDDVAQPRPPVDLFPRARLTYAECLQLREAINQALQEKNKKPTTGR